MAANDGVFRRKPAMKTKLISIWSVIVVMLLLLAYANVAAQQNDARTVIGPRNAYLADGASALIAGDVEEGVRLTHLGLKTAQGSRERKAAHSNLCAGYLRMGKLPEALRHCNEALKIDENFWRAYNNRALVYMLMGRYEESEADIARGQEIQPRSDKLKIAKGMLLDETDPVQQTIEIDERRIPIEEGDGSARNN